MAQQLIYNRRLLAIAMVVIVLAGTVSLWQLPRMEDPLLVPRFATINTRLPGAAAERVEALVTEPLEDELRSLEEIKEIRSSSQAGISSIHVELRDEINETAVVWARVRDRLADVAPQLPQGTEAPDFEELEVRAFALIVALRWEQDDQPNHAVLRRLAKQLEDRLRAVAGTEDVKAFGAPAEEYVVTVAGAELAARGLSFGEVAEQVTASDAKVSSGRLRENSISWLTELDTELDSLARISAIPIRTGTDGQVVQLGDIAEVTKAIRQPPRSAARVSDRSAVVLGVLARETQRIDRWQQSIDQVLSEFQAELPAATALHRVFEQQRYVSARLNNLLGNLVLGGLAVIVVVGWLMGWRNALIVGTALPLSSLMVIAGLRVLGIPIHQMSITGLILSLGLLIDCAIVVVDEVSQRMSEGHDAVSAVRGSVRQLAVPLFSSTLTTALAFAPIALMPGPAGEFVGSIAVSVMLAIGSSLFLSLTVIPALAALLAPQVESSSRRAPGWHSDRLANVFQRALVWLMAVPGRGVMLAMLLPLLGFWHARRLPEQFFPPADRDQFQIELELPAQASLAQTDQVARNIRSHLLRRPEVADVHWFLGESAPMFYYNLVANRKDTPHYAQAFVQLNSVPRGVQLFRELQADLDRQFPQASVLVRQLEQGPPFRAPLEIRVFGPELDEIARIAQQVRSVLATTSGVIHTRDESASCIPKVSVQIDEREAVLGGLSHELVADQLADTLDGVLGGLVLESTEGLPVRVRLDEYGLADLAALGSLELVALLPGDSAAHRVPLSAVAELSLEPDRAVIQHLDGERMQEVQAFLPAGALPAEAMAEFTANWQRAGLELPLGYTLRNGGEAAERNEAVSNLMGPVGLLASLMIATLVLSFRSFRLAGIVLVVGVLSVGLGVGALSVFGYPFGFMAIIGTMGLIGVAINDAIVVLAALREHPQALSGDSKATVQVVLRATRHVIATSLTTVAGFAPLVIAGGGFWPPLAITIAGGVVGATALALVLVPCVFLLAVRYGHAWSLPLSAPPLA